MTLRETKPGQEVKVLQVKTESGLKHRILDMGITSGVKVKLIKVAPLGDPLEVTVRGYQLSLRKSEADAIDVELISPSA